MNKVEHIQVTARRLARSGKFRGWAPIVFELRFQDGFKEAREWLYSAATRDEIDRLCAEARASTARLPRTPLNPRQLHAGGHIQGQ